MKSSVAVKKFFDLLGKDEDEAALQVFRGLAFPEGIDKPPSPAAKDAMDSGEWDAKLSVALYCLRDSSCGKRIGSAVPVKVCVKHSMVCSVKSHQISKTTPILPTEFGWRIGVGSTISEGVYATPFLSIGDSGPISEDASRRLYDTDGRPFTMPVAHWRMLFAIYLEDSVLEETPTRKESEDLSVDTTFRFGKQETEPVFRFGGVDEDSEHPTYGSAEETRKGGDSVPLDRNMGLMRQAVQEARYVLEPQIQAVDTKVEAVDAKVEALDTSHQEEKVKISKLLATMSGMLSRLEDRMDKMEKDMREYKEDLQETQNSVKVTATGTDRLAARVRTGGIIHFHGHSFGSPDELITFCSHNRVRVGCGADAFLLMNLERSQVVAEEDSIKNRKGRTDTKIGTSLESLFIASFDTTIPASLAPSKTTIGDSTATTQVLKKLMKSFAYWESDDCSEGVKLCVEASLERCRTRVDEFASECSMTVGGEQFCSRLMADSDRFVSSFVSFLTKFYQTYLKVSGMKDTALWDLCLEIMAHIVEELARVRNCYVDSAATRPNMYYWGMLRAWEIQQRYLGNKFINDPSLMGILVRRALLRKDDSVVSLEKEVRTLSTKVASLAKK